MARRAAAKASEAQLMRLQAVIAEKEQSIFDQKQAVDEILTRLDTTKRAKKKHLDERDELQLQLEAVNRTHESDIKTIERLREAKRNTDAELETIRAELSSSSIPEKSQLEQLRAENRQLLGEKEALEKKAKSTANSHEFLRQQYQEASTKAVEHADQIRILELEIASLRTKASGEAVRLREITNRTEVETHMADNKRLRLENEELKEQLKRKERGRGMTTRTGSAAPRSPRLGASPGRSRAGSRAPGSRPQSPVRSFNGARRGRGLVEQSL